MNSVSSAIRPAARASSATSLSTRVAPGSLASVGSVLIGLSSPIGSAGVLWALATHRLALGTVLLDPSGRQAQGEARAACGNACRVLEQVQRAPHARDELTTYGQTESKAAAPTGGAAPLETLKDALTLGLGHARTVVAHRHLRPRLAGRGPYAHARALRRNADRVVQQDPHDSRHRTRVTLGPACGGGVAHVEVHVPLAGAVLEFGGHRTTNLAKLDRLGTQRHLRVQAAQVQEVRSKVGEPA